MKLTDVLLPWSLVTYIPSWTNCTEKWIPRKFICFDDPKHHDVVPPVITAFDSKHRTGVVPPLTRCDLSSRRILLLQHGLLIIFPSIGRCEAIPPECRNGAILPESAVPGAYQQVCMTLPERSITLKSIGQEISVLQGASVGAGRTGVAVWNSCILLTRLLDSLVTMDRNFLTGKTVMELGCGTGLASIAASPLGAARVLATDGNPDVVELARQNAHRNRVDNVESKMLQWGFLDASDYAETADLVIGSDLTYNSGTWRLLAETLSTVLKPGGMVLYLTLGHSGFNVEGELRGFLSVVQSEGLEVITERAPRPLDNLSQTLLDTISLQEQSVLDGTGGVRVVLLLKPKL